MVTDSISDLIVRLTNAGQVGKETLTMPYSNMSASILELLTKEGYIKGYSKKGKKVTKALEVSLMYKAGGAPRIAGVQRISRLSKRLYNKAKDIKPVKNGHGMLVLTTPKGILSDKMAKKDNVGGEPLFKIW